MPVLFIPPLPHFPSVQNTASNTPSGKAPVTDCLAEGGGRLVWSRAVFYPVNYPVASGITGSLGPPVVPLALVRRQHATLPTSSTHQLAAHSHV